MTNIYTKTTYFVGAIALAVFAVFAFATGATFAYENPEVRPEVDTITASDIRDTSATLQGYYASIDGREITTWFEYGEDKHDLYESTPMRSQFSSVGPAKEYVDGLELDTKYYFRFMAMHTTGTVRGDITSFRTPEKSSAQVAYELRQERMALRQRDESQASADGGIFGLIFNELDRANANSSNSSNETTTSSTSSSTTTSTTNESSSTGFTNSTNTTTTGNSTPIISRNTSTTQLVDSREVVIGGNSNRAVMILDNGTDQVYQGETYSYMLSFENVSVVELDDVVIDVMFPEGFILDNISEGGRVIGKHEAAVTLGDIAPGQKERITIIGTITRGIDAIDMEASATASFTVGSIESRENILARDIDNFSGRIMGASAVYSFLPVTFGGWLLVFFAILVIIIVARVVMRAQKATVVAEPVKTDTPVAPAPVQTNDPYTHTPPPPANLPE